MVVEAKVAVEEVEVCQPINGTLGALKSDVDGIRCLADKEPKKEGCRCGWWEEGCSGNV